MPDTGAPWNIPYVAPSDLVRDYPSASEDLADAIADALDAAGNPGIGSNVVQTISSTTFSTSSTSYVDVTDLEVTITPSSSSSKILLIAQVAVNPGLPNENSNTSSVKIQFAGGNITTDTYEPIDMFGARPNDSERYDRIFSNESTTMIYLDSPATTSAVTYNVQVKTANFTALVNQNYQGKNTDSSITAIEVAA